jgi:hypothetical protein
METNNGATRLRLLAGFTADTHLMGRETMIGHMKRTGALTLLVLGLAACSSSPAEQPRTVAPAGQSGTMNSTGMDHSNMGQMDQAQMMQHCRAMMQGGGAGMTQGSGATANSGSMGQMDHAQMMQHCRAMMQGEGGSVPTR